MDIIPTGSVYRIDSAAFELPSGRFITNPSDPPREESVAECGGRT